jgi:hypothetical protein
MKLKYKILTVIIVLLTAFISLNMLTAAKAADNSEIKRGAPPYDYIIGKDRLPHFRVFFWLPLCAENYIPYAASDVDTDVSHHGPVENWSVVETDIKTDSEKLVCIVVPKTFVFLHGRNFYKLIYLKGA